MILIIFYLKVLKMSSLVKGIVWRLSIYLIKFFSRKKLIKFCWKSASERACKAEYVENEHSSLKACCKIKVLFNIAFIKKNSINFCWKSAGEKIFWEHQQHENFYLLGRVIHSVYSLNNNSMFPMKSIQVQVGHMWQSLIYIVTNWFIY